MTKRFNCPKCGKPMVEAKKWPGMWECPDYVAINNSPPYEFKCTGSHLTNEGVKAFESELEKQILDQLKSKN